MLTLVAPKDARKTFASYFCLAFLILITLSLIFSQKIGFNFCIPFILFCASFLFWENVPSYLANPLSILHTIFNLIFFAIPALFLIYVKSWGETGLDWWFGVKLNESESTYIANLAKSLYFLTLCSFLGCLAMASVRNKTTLKELKIDAKKFLIIGSVVIILGNISSFFYHQDIGVLDGPAVSIFSYLALFLQDYAILCLAIFLLANAKTSVSLKKVCKLLILIWIVFNITSKSALFKVFLLFAILPVGLFQKMPNQKLYILSKKTILILFLLITILFQIGFEFKQSRNAGNITYFEATKNIAFSIFKNENEKKEMCRLFFTRLSMELSYFNVFFFEYDPVNDKRLINHYAAAILASFVNQAVPGTPFPKSTGISNQYVRSIVMKEKIDTIDFRGDENSNPYTCIGFLWLFSGYLAPILYFILCLGFSKIISSLSYPLLAIPYSTLFFGLMGMSGIENILKIFCVMLLNYYFVYILCCEKKHKTR
jgi:hypothetical protein